MVIYGIVEQRNRRTLRMWEGVFKIMVPASKLIEIVDDGCCLRRALMITITKYSQI